MLRESILYNLIIIGEASSQLPDQVYEFYPTIPWHGMRGLRNVLTHEYFKTDFVRIWEIITDDLPETGDRSNEIWKKNKTHVKH